MCMIKLENASVELMQVKKRKNEIKSQLIFSLEEVLGLFYCANPEIVY